MTLPAGMRTYYRTSNHIERLHKELKRRSKVIGIFPNESSLIRLMGSVLIEQNSISQARKSIFGEDAYQKSVGIQCAGETASHCRGTDSSSIRLTGMDT
jgi:transposase-like protein